MLSRITVGRSALLSSESSLVKLAKRKTIVLCVHGMYGGAWYFGPWLEMFREKGLGAIALDLRGHHGAPLALGQTLDDVTMQDYANDVSYAMAALRGVAVLPNRIVLLGHSMGGLVVQMTAAREECGALVLVASALPKYRMPRRFLPASLTLQFGRRTEGDTDTNGLLPPDESRARRMFAGIPEPLMSETIARLVPESAMARREVVHGINIERCVPAPPTLIVAGKRDPIVPPSLLLGLHLSTPSSAYFSCRSGHFPMLEPVAAEVAHRIVLWTKKAVSRQE